MVRLILIIVVLTSCTPKKIIYRDIQTADNAILLYQNYLDEGYELTDSFMLNQCYFKNNDFISSKPIINSEKGMQYDDFADINKLHKYYEVTGSFFKWLVQQKSILFNKEIEGNDTIQIEKISPYVSIYFLGHLKSKKKYNSSLFLIDKMKNDPFMGTKSVIQINSMNNKITSIRRIAGIIKESDWFAVDWTEEVGANFKYSSTSENLTFSDKALKEIANSNQKIEIYTDYCFYLLDNKGHVIIKSENGSN